MRLEADGAERIGAALDATALQDLCAVLADQPSDQAGVRLFNVEGLSGWLAADGRIGALAAARMPAGAQPVRAILFDKTLCQNWALPWHQDRVIAVREKVKIEGFGPWTRKHGALHVQPPFDLLSRMITLRVHLDPVPETNAPLIVALGSHRLGRITETDVPAAAARCGEALCLADAGDVWLYATPILHASRRAQTPGHRRVLQVDYSADGLPGGLEWLGV